MKNNPILHLNKAFESRIRLGIMSLLIIEGHIDFNALKERLGASDGNLATHIKGLEQKGYLKIVKRFINRKPNTTYHITPEGQTAFETHIKHLEELIKLKN